MDGGQLGCMASFSSLLIPPFFPLPLLSFSLSFVDSWHPFFPPFPSVFPKFPLFPSWDVWPLPSSHQSFLSPSFPPSPSFLSFLLRFPLSLLFLFCLSQDVWPMYLFHISLLHSFPIVSSRSFWPTSFHILTPDPLPQVVPFSHLLLSFNTFHPLNVSWIG